MALSINLIDAHRRHQFKANIYIGVAFISLLYIYLYVSGGTDKTAFVWYFTYPLIACYLMGSQKGVITSMLMLLPVLLMLLMQPAHPFYAKYDINFVLRFWGAYLFVSAFSYLFEQTRETNQKELNAINQSLEDQVSQRTVSLVETNVQLTEEIEKRKEAAQSLHLSQEILITILDSIDATIYVADIETYEILFMNKQMKKIFGRDMTGELCWQAFRSESEPCRYCSNPFLLDSQNNSTGVYVWEGQNPKTGIWYINYDRAIKWIDSRLVRIQIAFDIDERRRAELMLRESEERYRLLADNITDNIWVLDLNTLSFSYVSPSISGITGFEADEITGSKLEDIIVPASLELATNVLTEELSAVNDNTVPAKSRILELEQFHKNGSTVWTEVSVRFIYDNKGQPVSVLGVTRDIGARKKLQDQLQQASKMEAIGNLAGGIAHDFNNMLGVIIGHAELGIEEVDPSQSIYNDLKEIHDAANRSADLTRQLLAFARKQTILPVVLNLNDTVSGMLKILRRLIGEDIELVWKPGADLWPIKIDPAQIDQVLANLCVNARYAIPGTGKIIIETKCMFVNAADSTIHEGLVPGEYVLLMVSDTGAGMDKETLDKLFEPFFTTKEFGVGTGLGLSTVYGIVKQNDGYIYASSQLGEGASFNIFFHRSSEIDEFEDEARAEILEKGNETVLLVEDEPSFLKLSKSILERLGYTILKARTPSEALTIVSQNKQPIDLLLTDVVMPEMNGKELQIEVQRLNSNVKVLFNRF